jgi:hypothetical protein
MKTFALAIAAAALLAPALIQSASAESASVNIRVGTPGYTAYGQERVVVSSPSRCRTVTTKTKRANGSVVISKKRVCG